MYSCKQPSLWVVSCQYCTAGACSCPGLLHSYFAAGIYSPQHFLSCKKHHSTAMSWGKGEVRRERRANQGHKHRDQTKAAQESCILYPGYLPFWDPYPGPSTSSPVFLICEKHLSSILQKQSLNFYLDLDSAVHNTSDRNSRLC